jgi:hypothetical protein
MKLIPEEHRLQCVGHIESAALVRVVSLIFYLSFFNRNLWVFYPGAGELPDIEIKHADIVGPLAALAERDPTFARLLLTILCGAVYSLPSKGPDIKAEVRPGVGSRFAADKQWNFFCGLC